MRKFNQLNMPAIKCLTVVLLAILIVACKGEEKLKRADGKGDSDILELHQVHLAVDHEGKDLYEHYCAFCHGDTGGGDGLNAFNLDPRPRNFRDIGKMSPRSREVLVDIVSDGGEPHNLSRSMPPWKYTLNREEIAEIVDYITTFYSQVDQKEDTGG